MMQYCKKNISTYILCLIISFGLSMNLIQGFNIPDNVITNFYRLVAWIALLLALFYVSFYSKISRIIASVLLLTAAITGVYYTRATDPSILQNSIFYCVSFLTTLLVFLLGRSTAGSLIIFPIGVTAFIILSILQYNHFISGYLMFLAGDASLFFIQRYQKKARQVNAGRTSSILFPLISIFTCIGALVLSFATYQYIIKPLNPPSQEIALVTQLKSMQVLEKTGVYSELHLYDNSLLTSKTNSKNRTLQKDIPQPKAQDFSPSTKQQTTQQLLPNFIDSINHSTKQAEAISYAKSFYWLPIILLITPAILLLLILMKKFSRRLWYNRTRKEVREKQIIRFYQYFIKKLSLIGCKKNPGDTLNEFMTHNGRRLRGFSSHHSDLQALTAIYNKVHYGSISATEAEYAMFLHFYKYFLKNCRKTLGSFRYSLKFFFL